MHLLMSVSKTSMVLQNYQTLIEITANMIYIVALGVGLKCLHKVHLNTQWGGGAKKGPALIGLNGPNYKDLLRRGAKNLSGLKLVRLLLEFYNLFDIR